MTNKVSTQIKYIVYAAPDEVYAALTNPSLIAQWIEGAFVFELKEKGTVEFFDGWVKGEVENFIPSKELSYTWKPNTWDKKSKPSLVTITFTKVAAGTEVEITHSDFPNADEATKHQEGWITYFLDPLNDYFIARMK
ncbi:MAG: SRPBCC domain-containing protein [Bacteroidetes bacterium]|jgi:uncharacterized protein YndB with AHSA1/START domain|nr:SRPBCC domain-containing protein [Bacteroidota bacterium]